MPLASAALITAIAAFTTPNAPIPTITFAAPVAATAAAAAAQPADDSDILRIYDLRDTLSRLRTPAAPTSLILTPKLSGEPFGSEVNIVANVVADSATDMIENLLAASNLTVAFVQGDLYGVRGNSPSHQQFEEVLSQLRAVAAGTYDLEIVLTAVEGAGPALGERFDPTSGTPVLRIRQSVRGQTPATLSALQSRTYISAWSPVVADSAVGYQSITAVAKSGFVAQVTLNPTGTTAGGGGGGGGPVELSLSGTLLHTDIQPSSNPATGDSRGGPSQLNIGLPQVSEQTITSQLPLPPDQPTVIAVIGGGEGDPTIVVTARARRLSGGEAGGASGGGGRGGPGGAGAGGSGRGGTR